MEHLVSIFNSILNNPGEDSGYLLGCYSFIIAHGGLRTMWSKFLGPKQGTETTSATTTVTANAAPKTEPTETIKSPIT